MKSSDIARLIIRIEETVNPESEYYGTLVKWWEQEKNLWHYGIGLSNTHFFNIGTIEAKELQLLKRHDIIEQRDLDIRVMSDIHSPFESDEIIERLKYSLRWLNDLPEDSKNNKKSGKNLAFLIFTDDENLENKENEPVRNDINYHHYLKHNSPQLKQNKIRDWFKKGRSWVIIFLCILFVCGLAIAIVIDSIPIDIDPIKTIWGWEISLKFILSILVLCIGILIVIITSNVISKFKWSGFQKKSFWDWLQLLIVPVILAFGAFYLNAASQIRDDEIADERKQQELLKDYFTKMQNLIIETERIKSSRSSNPGKDKPQSPPKSQPINPGQETTRLLPEFIPVATALTLEVLDELDGKRKGKVIVYLADSGLIVAKDKDKDKNNPIIHLTTANLEGIELKDVDLNHINISSANMKKANLTTVGLIGANLSSSDFSGSTLETIDFDQAILVNSNFYDANLKDITISDLTKLSGTCFSENYKDKIKTTENKPDFLTVTKVYDMEDKQVIHVIKEDEVCPKSTKKKEDNTKNLNKY